MYKNTAVNKKKKLILQYLLFYIAVIYLGVEDLKTRRKTKQPEPRTSTVRTLGVDWAAHGKPKPWWAAHGSLVWPTQPLCGVVGCARPWEKAEG